MKEESLLLGIGSQTVSRIVQLRVKVGSDLLSAIAEAAELEGIRTGVILSGIGALNRAIFRNLKVFPETYPVQKKDRIYLEVDSPMELVSLGGWIAVDESGKTNIHAHFSASTVTGDSVVTLGGHLTEGTIAGILLTVAIAVLEGENAHAKINETTKGMDIAFSDDRNE